MYTCCHFSDWIDIFLNTSVLRRSAMVRTKTELLGSLVNMHTRQRAGHLTYEEATS